MPFVYAGYLCPVKCPRWQSGSFWQLVAMPVSPNHALQRTPGFGVQLPGAAFVRPAQSRAVLPAMKPGTARAFTLRRRAHSRAPGPESLSLGSLGVVPPLLRITALVLVSPSLLSA